MDRIARVSARRLSFSVFTACSVFGLPAFGHCPTGNCDATATPVVSRTAASLLAPPPDKAAILVISAHPDDEGIFFGGTLPYYSQVRNLPTVLLSFTSGDWNTNNLTVREDEQRNAASVYGLKHAPIFPRFRDVPGKIDTSWDYWGDWTPGLTKSHDNTVSGNTDQGKRNAALYIAQQIRDMKPEVIATHDFDGEYGHGNHKAVALASAAAWDLAAGRSATIDGTVISPDSLTGKTWEAAKVYIHGDSGETHNALFHLGWEESRAELGNKSARDIANEGLDEHVSQRKPNVSTIFETGEVPKSWEDHYSEAWGLFASTVGADTETAAPSGHNLESLGLGTQHYGDFFENIDLTQFASFLADANRDGTVDAFDLAIMQGNLGKSVQLGSVSSGDANGDGLVTQADINLYNIAVPEPTSMALLGLSGLLLLRRRR